MLCLDLKLSRHEVVNAMRFRFCFDSLGCVEGIETQPHARPRSSAEIKLRFSW